MDNSEINSKVQLDLPPTQESIYTFLQIEDNEYNYDCLDGTDPVSDPEFLAYLAEFSFPSQILSLPLLPTSDSAKETTLQKKRELGVSKLGHCEHPKHVIYRQERYTLILSEPESSILKTVPRRGRPPKGSKPMEFTKERHDDYRMVTLTVRPLPKRLEPVVGKRQIKVCLTCLKKSDIDPEYLSNKDYIGPQPVLKRRKNI